MVSAHLLENEETMMNKVLARKETRQAATRLEAVIHRGIAKAPADCHAFNLLVLMSIFKSHGKPFSSDLEEIADKLFHEADWSLRRAAKYLRGINAPSRPPPNTSKPSRQRS